ncbi:MAG TPA: glycosyltransferase family 4 protein [Gaiellaceae bacterium]|nr:glycosyltransferase family 4 protein [Gaiellaceae bacterium]
MERLIFATQKLDPGDPVLAATVPMVHALAARVDELVVLCDSAVPEAVPANARVHVFGAPTQLLRGARFEAALARELRPRPLGVVAHMVPLYAVLAAPLVRPLRIPLVLWYTHWKGHAVVRAAERLSTAVASVDRRSFPLPSRKVHAIGHGIDVSEFACTETPAPPVRALVLGRYSPAKGLETILRGAALAGVHVEAHGSDETFEAYKRTLERLAPDAELGGPVPRSELPALFARSHVLVNNMRAGAPDKVVYEAAASCLPVLASNPVFDDLLPRELRFERDDPESLAASLRALDPRRRPELRGLVAARHSVDHWADGLLATVRAR